MPNNYPPDWLARATAAFDRRWVASVIRTSRLNNAALAPNVADQEDLKRICGLDTDVPWSDALAHAERLLVVWQVTDRLAA